MFDVGFSEIFLLGLIGLLVLGPERLPGVARTIGGFVRKARTSWASLRKTIEAEMAEADLSTPIKKAREELQQIGKDLTDIDMQGNIIPKRQSGSIKTDSATSDPTASVSSLSDSESSDSKSGESTSAEPETESAGGKSNNV